MSNLLNDPMFFYAIAFVIFMGLAYRFGRKSAINWIDAEILKVRSKLDEAEKLRAEAEATLVEYKAQQAAAFADAEDLVRNAKDEAVRLKAQAEADLKASLARQEHQATERIRLAEAAALADVRQHAIDLAMTAARQSLQTSLHDDVVSKLVDQAIADLPVASTKAKAA